MYAKYYNVKAVKLILNHFKRPDCAQKSSASFPQIKSKIKHYLSTSPFPHFFNSVQFKILFNPVIIFSSSLSWEIFWLIEL